MNEPPPRKLYLKLQRKGYRPDHVAEVGVYLPELSNIYDYIEDGIRTTLVEPDPESIQRIRDRFGDNPNVTLHPLAAYDFEGTLELSQRDASTFVSELESSPAIVNDGYVLSEADQLTVGCTTFDKIDDGTIDLISVDTEGSDWFVIKHMTSRPDVISVETHGAAYINPYISDIEAWMSGSGYVVFYRDKTDTVYVRQGAIALTTRDRIVLALEDVLLVLRRLRRRLISKARSRPS